MSIYKDLLFLHGYLSDLSVADDIAPRPATDSPRETAPRPGPGPAVASDRKHAATQRDATTAGCA